MLFCTFDESREHEERGVVFVESRERELRRLRNTSEAMMWRVGSVYQFDKSFLLKCQLEITPGNSGFQESLDAFGIE
jgi:hypothetical protein